MSETLPPHQNEPQTWRRELIFHREAADKLKPEETIALIGSFTESSLESDKEENETGHMSDYEYGMKQRIHAAALEQLTTLKVDESTDALNAIADRKVQLETALNDIGGDTRRTAEERKLREQLVGVKLLNNMYLSVADNLDTLAQRQPGDGGKHSPHNRAAAINEMIAQHNEQVSGSSETIANSPEVREAQERISARYAEQANQPQPAQSVDDARQKVAEAFGDTVEKEQQALMGEVARAAEGATRISTDRPNGVKLKSTSGDYIPRDGFTSFGDGLPQENNNRNELLIYGGSAEAFLFEPDTTTRYKTVAKTVETGGRFRKKTEQIEEQVRDGEVPTMVVNPATGQQEPGVKVAYQFNGNQRRENGQAIRYEGPDYVTESKRSGNQLFVEATLPKLVADKLRQEVTRNPEVAREFAKTLALNNGITEQVWSNVVRPPYDQIPDGWEMAVADLQKDTQYGDVRHKVVSSRNVKVDH